MLPSEMDDKHLVNCIRLIEARNTFPKSIAIYNGMVLEASDRGIAMDATRAEIEVDEQLTEQDAIDRRNKASLKAMQDITKAKIERSAIAHKAVATRRLNQATKLRKEKLFKDMTKNKVAVKRRDIRQRRIILED